MNVGTLLNLSAGGKEMLKNLLSQSPLAYLREMTGTNLLHQGAFEADLTRLLISIAIHCGLVN